MATAVVIKDGSVSVKAFKEVEHPLILDNYLDAFDLTIPLITVQITKIFKSVFKYSNKKAKRASQRS